MADASGNEIVVATEAPAPASLPSSPMELLSRALERGADLAMVEKLMDLSERHDKGLARKAFDAAVADAKAEIPVIIKNRKGHNSKYADLGAFAAAVNPVLAKYGLSYRYRSEQEGAAIRVTCVLSHRDGHSEETTLSGGPDTSGAKNSIQAIASTITYLSRYTLKLALGLADAEGDDDGKAAGGNEAISPEQLKELQSKITSTGADIERFCKYMQVEALPDIRQKDYAKALAAIAQKIKTKKQAGA